MIKKQIDILTHQLRNSIVITKLELRSSIKILIFNCVVLSHFNLLIAYICPNLRFKLRNSIEFIKTNCVIPSNFFCQLRKSIYPTIKGSIYQSYQYSKLISLINGYTYLRSYMVFEHPSPLPSPALLLENDPSNYIFPYPQRGNRLLLAFGLPNEFFGLLHLYPYSLTAFKYPNITAFKYRWPNCVKVSSFKIYIC